MFQCLRGVNVLEPLAVASGAIISRVRAPIAAPGRTALGLHAQHMEESTMPRPTISMEPVRELRRHAPSPPIEYRDRRLPGFVLRARSSGVHSWRVQLPNRRWITLGRMEQVALADAREAARHAARGLPSGRPCLAAGRRRQSRYDVPRRHLRAVDEKHVRQTDRTAPAHSVRGLRSICHSRNSRRRASIGWRATRRYRHVGDDAPARLKFREVSRVTHLGVY